MSNALAIAPAAFYAFPCASSPVRQATLAVPMDDDLTSQEDARLVAAAREGNLHAFDEIVRRHQADLARSLYRFCPHPADLEDLVQETFIKAYRKLDTWKPDAPLIHWLKRIAYNTGYDFFRRRGRNPVALADQAGENTERLDRLHAASDHPAREVGRVEQVQQLLATLPPDERTLLTLQYLEELSLRDIARQLGWSLAKAKVKSHRARAKLKQTLARHGIHDASAL